MAKGLADLDDGRVNRTDVLYGLGLFLLTALSRVPSRSQVLYHWDSVNFANGMRHFDVLQEHPQPPGYIVYVWLCRAVNLLFRDANATMVWISIVASGLAVVALYLLGRAMWNRRVGVIAALLLASSPLFWFYGEIALPHTLDTFLVLLALWLLYRVWKGGEAALWPAVVILGIVGGVRQQTLIFLWPVALYALWRVGWKRLLLVGLLGGVVCLAWFVPLMASCGGIGAYLEKMSAYSVRFQHSTSVLMGAGWSGLVYNLRKLSLYTAYGAGAALIPLGLYGVIRLVRRRWPQHPDRLAFLGLWMVPALLFYGLIHMGQQGLVFFFLPGFLLLGALGLCRLLERRQARMAATALIAVTHTAVFCLVPERPLGPGTQRLLTRETVVQSDRYFADRFHAVHENFLPGRTLILADNWDHVRYYLPHYEVLPFAAAQGQWEVTGRGEGGSTDTEMIIEQEGVAVVLFDPVLRAYNDTPALARSLPLENGGGLAYFVLTGERAFHYGTSSFGVTED